MYRYKVITARAIDGDTIECEVDVGFRLTTRQRFRLKGYNAPELRGRESSLGKKAKVYLDELLFNTILDSLRMELISYKTDSFGRWLCDFEINGEDLVTHLITEGYGVEWNGKGKRPSFNLRDAYPLSGM
jgi:micrococcal nuclease